MHVYEVRPRKDKRGVDLISDPLPFGRLLYRPERFRPMKGFVRKSDQDAAGVTALHEKISESNVTPQMDTLLHLLIALSPLALCIAFIVFAAYWVDK